MHRFSVRKLTAWAVGIGACLALTGGSVLLSAQGARTQAPQAQAKAKAKTTASTRGVASRKWAGATKPANARHKGAPVVAITGNVSDGSGAGWPLYSRLEFTSESTDPFIVFTDPVTGDYAADLFDAIDYTVTITAVGPGYNPLTDTLTTAGSPIEYDATLTVEGVTCDAPGYEPGKSSIFYTESFDGGVLPAGWEIVNDSTDGGGDWYVTSAADPCGDFDGNDTGGTGAFAVINSDCDGFVTDDSSLITGTIDMTGVTNPFVTFATDYITCCGQIGDVDYTIDGGTTWINALHRTDADGNLPGPATLSAGMPQAANQAEVRIRWHFQGFFSWWWQVDDVQVGDAACDALTGGLIVGNVFDLNTDEGLAGATVAYADVPVGSGGQTSTTTFDVPEDPNQPGGFYILFSPNASQPLVATLDRYGSDTQTATVVFGDTVRQDFHLPSASLTAAPSPINGIADPGGTDEEILTITNAGQVDAHVEIGELDIPYQPPATARMPSDSFMRQVRSRVPKKETSALSARNFPGLPKLAQDPPAATTAAGNLLASYPTDLVYGWGISYNTDENNFWVGNVGVAGGDDLDYQYLATDGSSTGETIDNSSWIDVFAADGAYNSRTGMLWRVNVGADTCIYEVDPVLEAPTGNSICPAFTTSERGLAYDPVSDTYYAGSWNDGVIVHFDGEGTILDQGFVGVGISGLAYNPRTQHLFATDNQPGLGPFDIYVVDAHNYEILSAFKIKNGPDRVTTPGGAAGLEADCDGNLWYVEQNLQEIFKVETDEANWCVNDVPWLSVDPTEGDVTAGGTLDITVTMDAAGLQPGLHQAQLVFVNDSPNVLDPVPVNFTVRFLDVPDANQFQAYIYGAAGAGIMTGCGGGNFCPDGVVTRAAMAGYIGRAVNGSGFLGTPYQGTFDDVTQQTSNANYIQWLVDQGITAGCGTDIYCPDDPNTRAQMSVFIVKAVEGSDFVPPACTGVFTDVPCPGGFAVDFIEYLADQGVTAGCGGGNFCPDANITNGQMAVFLVKAFNVPIQ